MPKWKKRYSPSKGGMITVGETDYPYMDILKISELVEVHNADIDALTAERDEWIEKFGKLEQYCANLVNHGGCGEPDMAVISAIAEGRDNG